MLLFSSTRIVHIISRDFCLETKCRISWKVSNPPEHTPTTISRQKSDKTRLTVYLCLYSSKDSNYAYPISSPSIFQQKVFARIFLPVSKPSFHTLKTDSRQKSIKIRLTRRLCPSNIYKMGSKDAIMTGKIVIKGHRFHFKPSEEHLKLFFRPPLFLFCLSICPI